jgi:hypothetical protein
MSAICHLCGGEKSGPLMPCKACDHVPRGDERPLAWLFSTAHLNPAELALAASRIREGEHPDPATHLHNQARAALGAVDLPTDLPLSTRQLIALGLANLLLTPLAGLATWWGLRSDRPSAAHQALQITIPIGAATTLAWIAVLVSR